MTHEIPRLSFASLGMTISVLVIPSEVEGSPSSGNTSQYLRQRVLSHAQEVLTRNFQKEIRNSAIWPQMVAEFGEAKAEELLKQCKGELKPGLPPDEAAYGPEDI